MSRFQCRGVVLILILAILIVGVAASSSGLLAAPDRQAALAPELRWQFDTGG